MKRNTIKKAVTAICAAAMTICPSVSVFGNSITASAAGAFISDPDHNNAINVDESQIAVTQTAYSGVSRTFKTSVSGGAVKSTASVAVPLLDRGTLTLKLTGTGLTEAKVKDMKLYSTTNYNGCTSSTQTWVKPTVTKSGSTFTAEFKLNAYGSALNFSTSALSGVSNLKVSSAVYKSVSNDSNYLFIKADVPNGYDDLYIRIRKDAATTNAMRTKWAKRLCVYTNSLSYMTGIKHGMNFLFFDDDLNQSWAYSNSYGVDVSTSKYALTSYCVAATQYEVDNMKNTGKDILSWSALHELSHSYGYWKTSNSFHSNFVYHDEALTNIRGITAVQNCDNLRPVYIMNDGTKLFNYQTAFDNFMKEHPNDMLMGFGQKIQKVGVKYQYETLEKFFAANSPYVTKDISYSSANNKNAAQIVKNVTGTSPNMNNAGYLKYVNTLRALYMISWNQSYNQYAFESFLRQDMDVNFMKKYINYEMGAGNFK